MLRIVIFSVTVKMVQSTNSPCCSFKYNNTFLECREKTTTTKKKKKKKTIVPIILCGCTCRVTSFFLQVPFFVSWLRCHHLVSAEQRQGKSYPLRALLIVELGCFPRYLCSLIRSCAVCSSKTLPFVESFCRKYIIRHANVD